MTLYSTNCSKCNILKYNLEKKGVIYNLCDDVDIMQKKGFMCVPKLELDDGKILDFANAINWLQKEVN